MADPVVHITDGVPDSGTGNITTLGQTLLDGANETIGAKADAKSASTDVTPITAMSVWKQISASVQAAAASVAGTVAVSGTFWQATQPISGTVTANAGSNLNTSTLALEAGGNLATIAGAVSSSKVATKAASGDFADGAIATIGAKTDAKSTATDTTSVSGISIWKQISASVQAVATSLAGTLTITQATQGYDVAVTLTRTNDTNVYLANDVIGAATGSTAALTFASMGPSGGSITITSAQLEIDATAVISGETSYRLYLYNVTPPGAYGDNTAWDLPSGDRASFLGYIDLGAPVDLGSTLYVENNLIGKQLKLSGTSLFAYLVTNGPYTPTASRVHVITLHTVAN